MKSEVIKLYLCSKHALNSAALDAGIGDNSCPPARFYIADAVGDFPHTAETCMMTVESAIIFSHVGDRAYAISANIPQVNVLQSSSSAGVNSVRHGNTIALLTGTHRVGTPAISLTQTLTPTKIVNPIGGSIDIDTHIVSVSGLTRKFQHFYIVLSLKFEDCGCH